MPKPKWLEPLEQFAHVFMGIGTRLIGADILWFRRERKTQWPPGDPLFIGEGTNRVRVFLEPRVIDMMNDIQSYVIGGMIVDWAQKGLIIFLLVKLYA